MNQISVKSSFCSRCARESSSHQMGFLGQILEPGLAKNKYCSSHSEYIIISLASPLASHHLQSSVASLGFSCLGYNAHDFSCPGAFWGGVQS